MVNVGKYTSPMDPADKYTIQGSYGFPGTRRIDRGLCWCALWQRGGIGWTQFGSDFLGPGSEYFLEV